ncbi:MAG TPA: TrbI/VirB10 family protein [Dyella sp.]|uniref:TrbI/VirB10 family protein n=1 Tax=Dyella sp. TaxID=1869338 RepID=UPI002B904C53|nr:TrbI/VirB10 family protein [Dyella sp.]HUB90282.1 TrbI/VirB10 family protein [Dyella sp.]
MSTNHPNASDRDPRGGNPYNDRYLQGHALDPDAATPVLKSYDMGRLNKRAVVLIGLVAATLVLLGLAILKNGLGHKPEVKPKAETVVVPDAPHAPTLPPATPPVTTQPQPVLPPAQPIGLVNKPGSPGLAQAQKPVRQGQSLLERRMQDAGATGSAPGSDLQNLASQLGVPGNPTPHSLPDAPTSAQPLTNPETLMTRGTYIRCVLETRIISDIPGFTSCVVTEPVYSFTGRRLLLPKGSKVLGKYDSGPEGDRMAVIWDRIITPTGIDVNMASPGVDGLGGAGYAGHLNEHWGSRISSALLISLLSDAFSYEAAKHGPSTASISNGVVVQTPFQSNTAQTLQQLAGQAVRKSANRPATVTINQGSIVNIYVAKDVDFSGVVARF